MGASPASVSTGTATSVGACSTSTQRAPVRDTDSFLASSRRTAAARALSPSTTIGPTTNVSSAKTGARRYRGAGSITVRSWVQPYARHSLNGNARTVPGSRATRAATLSQSAGYETGRSAPAPPQARSGMAANGSTAAAARTSRPRGSASQLATRSTPRAAPITSSRAYGARNFVPSRNRPNPGTVLIAHRIAAAIGGTEPASATATATVETMASRVAPEP